MKSLDFLSHLNEFAKLQNPASLLNKQINLPRGAYTVALATLANALKAQNHQENSAQKVDATRETITPLLVVVTPTSHDAHYLQKTLQQFLPHSAVELFPAWETLPHERLSPRADTVATRLRILYRLAHLADFPPLQVLLLPVRSLLQPIVAGLGQLEPVQLELGAEYELTAVQAQLVNAAYTSVDMVENRGEFAVRGGILDVFPPTEAHPLRVEFFGDEVTEIRSFSVADQRSIEAVEKVFAPPCREILLTEQVRLRAQAAIAQLPGAVDMLDKIAAGIAVEGMECLTPILVEQMVSFLTELPNTAHIIAIEPERLRVQAQSLHETTQEFLQAAWSNAAAGGEIPIQVSDASFHDLEQVQDWALAAGHTWISFSDFNTESALSIPVQAAPNYAGDTEKAFAQLRSYTQERWQVVLLVESAGLARRLAEQLEQADVPVQILTEGAEQPKRGVVNIVRSSFTAGFMASESQVLVLAASELLTRVRKGGGASALTMPKRRRKTVDPLTLRPGDYVVHDRHGVGQFIKLVQRTVGGEQGTQREYVVLEYAASKRGGDKDQLWVPTDQLYLISKYVGGDAPSLNKMGGSDWAKTKAKARAAVRSIAKELIRLYAQRRATRGFAFSPDTPWQRELEDAFEYVETPDQLSTIDEVKRDMESLEPMDRLISGDVGYGKTEIAVRAAFKAVQDGKQVAVLVPTTLLGQQHLETFRERYAGFPVRVAGLSRFQSAATAEKVKAELAAGTIDVVVGTHALVTGNVRFKDLGLVIIDEEQRFGVEHKEALKQLYPTVDVLAMSATPIPRTLEMAVTGIRQMSTLATPPEERHPILTYVGVQDAKQISAAIKREILRDGQVFYIHNRTESINQVALNLSELVPEARVAVAHGKMTEHQLEQVIQRFWEKEIDVLVCTTIVETGLDISNANTLIVEDAQKLGLSQLHQLRGRVGRGRERGYAYFLYPPEKAMTETAIERLRTIAAHTELGAGIQVALKDLEIRGAGNLLGGEQSGHIAGVGFDLYLRMISEAVAKLTGKSAADEEVPEQKVELPVDAFVPQSWVSAERLRLEIYAKISGADSEAARADIRQELVDRYGAIPVEVERLFALAQLRELASSFGIYEISVLGRNVRLAPVELPDFRQARLKRLYPKAMLRPAVRAILVPLPDLAQGRLGAAHGVGSFTNEAVLQFVAKFIEDIFSDKNM